MINVKYLRDKQKLIVKGHAESGEKGHDLVCASASILTYTLGLFVKNMTDNGQVKKATGRLDSGDSEVSCKVKGHEAAVTLVFDSICAGFDLLAKSYPENLNYKIVYSGRDRKKKRPKSIV